MKRAILMGLMLMAMGALLFLGYALYQLSQIPG